METTIMGLGFRAQGPNSKYNGSAFQSFLLQGADGLHLSRTIRSAMAITAIITIINLSTTHCVYNSSSLPAPTRSRILKPSL